MALSSPEATTDSKDTSTQEYRLHVYDQKDGKKFLIDTGSAVSVIPYAHFKRKLAIKPSKLYAANSTVINTYGELLLTLDLGLRREIRWPFIVADVQVAIIGADLIAHYGFLIDLQKRRIKNPLTKLSIRGEIHEAHEHGISTVDCGAFSSQSYTDMLQQYADVTKPSFQRRPLAETTIAHHIVTEGPPIAERPRKLAGARLEAAKSQINTMLDQGIIWKNGDWRPCGDYRKLNAKTVHDKYPPRLIHDLFPLLHKKKGIFYIRFSPSLLSNSNGARRYSQNSHNYAFRAI